jgi:hypothetical protein
MLHGACFICHGPRGRLAQLAEHGVYTAGVGGSSPSPPTGLLERPAGAPRLRLDTPARSNHGPANSLSGRLELLLATAWAGSAGRSGAASGDGGRSCSPSPLFPAAGRISRQAGPAPVIAVPGGVRHCSGWRQAMAVVPPLRIGGTAARPPRGEDPLLTARVPPSLWERAPRGPRSPLPVGEGPGERAALPPGAAPAAGERAAAAAGPERLRAPRRRSGRDALVEFLVPAEVAQLVEHATENRRVRSSILRLGTSVQTIAVWRRGALEYGRSGRPHHCRRKWLSW